MLRKLLFTLAVALGFAITAHAQVGQGSIKGTIVDGETGEPVPFANVSLRSGSSQMLGTTTDFDGKYTLKPIPPGTYDIQVSYVGFQTKKIEGIGVSSDRIVDVDVKLGKGIDLKEVTIVGYAKPLFEKDQTTTGNVTTRAEISKMAVRSVADIAKTAGGGVFSRDDGTNNTSVRGSRNNSSVMFIDGVKVIGATNLPKSAIEEVSVKTGGISAQYGDVTGSVTTVTTRGAFKEYFGSVEVLSSGFKTGKTTSFGLDKYGYNLFGFAVGGPILKKKDEKGNIVSSPFGFLLTGEFISELDNRPSVTTLRKPKDNIEAEIRNNPLYFDETGVGVAKRAELLRSSDFEEIDFRLNDNDRDIVLNGKFDIQLSELSKISVGGTFVYNNNNNSSRAFSLYNYENNTQSLVTDFRVFGRYMQRFENAEAGDDAKEEDKSLIKNAFFSLQADFSRRNTLTQDKNHESDFFKYGYLGRFVANTTLSYSNNTFNPVMLSDGREYRGLFLNAFDAPISYDYTASDINPYLANYTSNYYSFFQQGDPRYSTGVQVEGNGGIINGGTVSGNIYNMWSASGTVSNGYNKSEEDQIRLSGRGSADIGDHAIILGFEYEQRVDRVYNLDPRDLWDLGRLSVNSHILQIDSTNYSVSYTDPINPIDATVTFERRYGGDDQRSYFAYNMRRALGLDPSGIDFIDFDSYDINLYNMSYFSADQLINPANNIDLIYRGYDYKGKKLNTAPSLNDFFNATNDLGFKTRPVPAYQPVYIAGYIEDKFAFDDLIFRIGLRLDRFDANQPVLKDQYSFFPTRDVAYARTQGLGEVPSNIGDNFVVYVSDIENPNSTGVVGYRNPKTDEFFNAQGVLLNDPSVLQAGSSISPWLVEPDKRSTTIDLNTESFKDYEPQYTLMPRVSFSFPISDEATFFANYDILTQRPSGENTLEPIDMIFIANHNRIINNPNLKPVKRINYEIGFKQKLSPSSALTLSSFYGEQRDNIQVRKLVGAYPEDYLTYDNIDFGTVKGFSIDYDMRSTKNVSLRVNYTIQFSAGTGSSSTSALNLVNSDQPNLRSIFPYSSDRRHNIVTTIDY
ncbi:MAG: carboxypeptidase regulatory-like domain-containing protein, partial [Flavobacteriales bacterium]|nr:carboxypeptidase regulatory-like domain-containing protein [Flavobacteriales bacterium]